MGWIVSPYVALRGTEFPMPTTMDVNSREIACLHLSSAQIKDVFDVKGRSLWVCFDAAGPQREYNVGDCFCLGEMYSVDERKCVASQASHEDVTVTNCLMNGTDLSRLGAAGYGEGS